ncbi:MAG TPA: hypothetical protein VHX65_08645 [Pirellulales bacterium]|jgi:hypothetical protein|nr:hypothetical protein [Pirellulales bacterium]
MKRALLISGMLGLMLMLGCWKKAESGPSAPGWSGFNPDNGKFTVAMPGTPTETPLGTNGKMWTSSSDGMTYSVSYQELQLPPGTSDTDQAEQQLDAEEETYLTLQEGKHTGDRKPLIVGGVPGREVDIDIDGKTIRRVRMALAGNRLYMIEVSGPKDKVNAADTDAFLDSFRVGK